MYKKTPGNRGKKPGAERIKSERGRQARGMSERGRQVREKSERGRQAREKSERGMQAREKSERGMQAREVSERELQARKMQKHQQGYEKAGRLPEKETWQAGNMLYPLPAVMVSCGREGEKPNIITVAWAGTVCTNPPMVSISVRPGRYSHAMIEQTGEFVINLVTKDLVHACDWCGVRSGREHDKFAQCHLDALPAENLKWAPLIAQSPVNIECRVKQKISLGSHDMFLADVICVHADKAGMDENGRYDLGGANLITYSHGEYYALGEMLGTFGYSVKKDTTRKASAGERGSAVRKDGAVEKGSAVRKDGAVEKGSAARKIRTGRR